MQMWTDLNILGNCISFLVFIVWSLLNIENKYNNYNYTIIILT